MALINNYLKIVARQLLGLVPLAFCASSAFAGNVSVNGASDQMPINNTRLPTMGCMIEPSMRIDVSSPVAGVIHELPVKLGQSVEKGSVLFSLRSGVEKASVDLAKVRTEFASRKVERNDSLYNEKLISTHERDEFNTEFLVAKSELAHAEQVLAQRTINSPIDGVVIDRFSDPGEFVSTDPIVVLASLNPLKVEMVFPYESFGSIPKDTELTIYPAEPVGGEYKATVSLVDPIIDAASGTFRVRAELSNPNNKLPAGIKCRASR